MSVNNNTALATDKDTIFSSNLDVLNGIDDTSFLDSFDESITCSIISDC